MSTATTVTVEFTEEEVRALLMTTPGTTGSAVLIAYHKLEVALEEQATP